MGLLTLKVNEKGYFELDENGYEWLGEAIDGKVLVAMAPTAYCKIDMENQVIHCAATSSYGTFLREGFFA